MLARQPLVAQDLHGLGCFSIPLHVGHKHFIDLAITINTQIITNPFMSNDCHMCKHGIFMSRYIQQTSRIACPLPSPSWCPAGAHAASAVPLAAALQSQVGTRGILDISLSPGLALARVTGPCQPLERGPSVRCPP